MVLVQPCSCCMWLTASMLLLQGEWQLAEQLFQELEGDSGSPGPSEPATPSAAAAASPAAAMSQADWGSPSAEGSNIWGQEQQPAGTPSGLQPLAIPSAGRAGEMSFAGAGARHSMDQRMSSDSFGEMPKHMAEQVGWSLNLVTAIHVCEPCKHKTIALL